MMETLKENREIVYLSSVVVAMFAMAGDIAMALRGGQPWAYSEPLSRAFREASLILLPNSLPMLFGIMMGLALAALAFGLFLAPRQRD